jgi:hypothetical protein
VEGGDVSNHLHSIGHVHGCALVALFLAALQKWSDRIFAALHKKDEDHKEEDAFIIPTRCLKISENKKKQKSKKEVVEGANGVRALDPSWLSVTKHHALRKVPVFCNTPCAFHPA